MISSAPLGVFWESEYSCFRETLKPKCGRELVATAGRRAIWTSTGIAIGRRQAQDLPGAASGGLKSAPNRRDQSEQRQEALAQQIEGRLVALERPLWRRITEIE